MIGITAFVVVRAYAARLLGVLLIVGLTACGGEPVTPEERVRAWLQTAESAAEKTQITVLQDMISARYKDRKERNRRAMVQLLALYFRRHHAIHVLTRIERIDFPKQDLAKIVLYAAMAASPIDGAQSLTNIKADLYRFELHLTKEGDAWKLLSATWVPASTKEFILLGQASRGTIYAEYTL